MTTDPSVPSHLLGAHVLDTRASRVSLPASAAVRAEIWLGGVHTSFGEALEVAHLAASWVVDCSGELPAHLAGGARRFIPRVFADAEARPPNYERILTLADELAEALTREPLAGDAPERVYVFCQQGLNRSALVAGRLLRRLGLGPDEAVAAVLEARPGGLSNRTFMRLVKD